MRYSIAFLFFAFLYCTGCKSPTDSAQSQDLFSLQKAWIYSTQTYDVNGPTGSPIIDSVYLVSTTTDKSKTNYLLSNNNTIIVDSNGFMTGYAQTDCICEADKIPAIAGDTVMRHDSIPMKSGGKVVFGTIIIFVENTDTTITVPAGTFRCMVYELKVFANTVPTGASGLSYISPSIGLVESDSYNVDVATGKIYLSSRKQLVRTVK